MMKTGTSYTYAIMISIVTILVFLFIQGAAEAVPFEEWNKTFVGSYDERAYAIQQTIDGGYIIAGFSPGGFYGYGKAFLLKTDAYGNKVWNKTYDFTTAAYSVKQTSDGGYIIAGAINFGSEVNPKIEDVWLLKTDAYGNEQWNKTFKGTWSYTLSESSDIAYSVQQTKDGGYILTGHTVSSEHGYRNAWLIKTDNNGIQQWNKIFGQSPSEKESSYTDPNVIPYYDWTSSNIENFDLDFYRNGEGITFSKARSVQQTFDDGYILAGHITINSYTYIWLIKTDAYGNHVWNKIYSRARSDPATLYQYIDSAYSVQQTSDGGYVIAGSTEYTANKTLGHTNIWLIKTDINGNHLWNKTFGSRSWAFSEAYSVQQTKDGGYIIAGEQSSLSAWLIKTDADGNEQWNITFGGYPNVASARSVLQTSDGSYVLAGTFGTQFIIEENKWKEKKNYEGDVWLVKVSDKATTTPTQTPSTPTPTITAALAKIPTASPPTEKATGFEVVLATATLLIALIIRQKKIKQF